MSKPRIKKIAERLWKCSDGVFLTIGHTPIDAYEQWVVVHRAYERIKGCHVHRLLDLS